MSASPATVDAMTDPAASCSAGLEARPSRPTAYVLDIVIPVFDEKRDLEGSVRRLHRFLAAEVPYAARITLADNGQHR